MRLGTSREHMLAFMENRDQNRVIGVVRISKIRIVMQERVSFS